jgi:hypothetical protein
MKKFLYLTSFIVITFYTLPSFAQPYAGFRTGSYIGLQGAIFNPACLADNRLSFDVNLVSVSFSVENNYIELSSKKLFNPSNIDHFTDLKEVLNGKTKSGLLSVDIMGPGFFMPLSKNDAIGFYTRVRGMINVDGMDQASAQSIYHGIQTNQFAPFQFSGSNFNLNADLWAEYDIPYARVIYNNGYNVVKAGVTLKYLQGITSDYVDVSNYNYSYQNDQFMASGTGTVDYGHSQNQFWTNESKSYFTNAGHGFAVDMGAIYEYRPDPKKYAVGSADGNLTMRRDVDAYKVKLGLSLTDWGAIFYQKAVNSRNYDPDLTPFALDVFRNMSGIPDFDTRFASLPGNLPASDNGKYTMDMPLALNLSADYNFENGFYANFNPIIALKTGTSDVNKNHYYSTYYITARYEKRWWGVYVPFGLSAYTGFNTGLALRLGPLFLGSENLISNLATSWVNSVNFFLGLKVPIPYKKAKAGGLDCPKL